MPLVSHGPCRTTRPNSRSACRSRFACWLVGIAGLFAAGDAAAQPGSNLRERWVKASGDTLKVDTLSIVPGSLLLFSDSAEVDPTSYRFDPYAAVIIWKDAPDSALVRYRVMPLLLGGTRFHKDPSRVITTNSDREDPFRYSPPRQQN